MRKFFTQACDPISCETHTLGALFALIGTILIIAKGMGSETETISLASGVIFGVSMVALYTASSVFHYFDGSEWIKTQLRRWDHAMIYVLIAGSYTPVCLSYMTREIGIPFIKTLWIVAAVGILLKIFWLNAPRTLSTLFYLGMGWSIMLQYHALTGIPAGCLGLIVAGGVAYSIGAIFYILRKPNFSNNFGFHELFHVFILIGSGLHFAAVYFYII